MHETLHFQGECPCPCLRARRLSARASVCPSVCLSVCLWVRFFTFILHERRHINEIDHKYLVPGPCDTLRRSLGQRWRSTSDGRRNRVNSICFWTTEWIWTKNPHNYFVYSRATNVLGFQGHRFTGQGHRQTCIGVARILSAGVHFFTTQQKLLKIDSCSGWGCT